MSGSITNGGTIGSGSDSIVLDVAEDQAGGVDAQFTVSVDGQQIGGLQTASALQSAGQEEQFTFLGNYGVGPHTVAVTFTNNYLGPGVTGDRNLYVDGVTYDGQSVSNTTTGVYQSPLFPPNSMDGNIYGNAVYTVTDTTPVPAGAPATSTTSPAAVSVGSGADTLVLNMAEDYYEGDAQFTVSVDGQQIGGTQTVTASVAQGQFQEFDVRGNFGPGNHTVTVDYLNDGIGGFYAGTTDALDSEDRNLYVIGMSLDGGQAASGAPWEQATTGSQSFTVTAGNDPAATAASSGLFADDGAAASPGNPAIASTDSSTTATTTVTTDATPATTTDATSATPTPPSIDVTTDGATTPVSGATAGTTDVDGNMIVLTAPGVADATLGSTSSSLAFIGMSSIALTGGAGDATVTADAGANSFTAGRGTLEVTGGSGADAYVYHAHDGDLTIDDFSAAKGDTLTIGRRLEGSMQETSDGQGGTLLTFLHGTGSIDIKDVATLPLSDISWK